MENTYQYSTSQLAALQGVQIKYQTLAPGAQTTTRNKLIKKFTCRDGPGIQQATDMVEKYLKKWTKAVKRPRNQVRVGKTWNVKLVMARQMERDVNRRVDELAQAASGDGEPVARGDRRWIAQYQKGVQEMYQELRRDELKELQQLTDRWNQEGPPPSVQALMAQKHAVSYCRQFSASLQRQTGMRIVILGTFVGPEGQVLKEIFDTNDETGGVAFQDIFPKVKQSSLWKNFDKWADVVVGSNREIETDDEDDAEPSTKHRPTKVELERDDEDFPILPRFDGVWPKLPVLEKSLRTYLNNHYEKASGVSKSVPWDTVAAGLDSFVDAKHLPADFQWKDPSKLKQGELHSLFNFWYQRLDDGEVPFYFKGWYSSTEGATVAAIAKPGTGSASVPNPPARSRQQKHRPASPPPQPMREADDAHKMWMDLQEDPQLDTSDSSSESSDDDLGDVTPAPIRVEKKPINAEGKGKGKAAAVGKPVLADASALPAGPLPKPTDRSATDRPQAGPSKKPTHRSALAHPQPPLMEVVGYDNYDTPPPPEARSSVPATPTVVMPESEAVRRPIRPSTPPVADRAVGRLSKPAVKRKYGKMANSLPPTPPSISDTVDDIARSASAMTKGSGSRPKPRPVSRVASDVELDEDEHFISVRAKGKRRVDFESDGEAPPKKTRRDISREPARRSERLTPAGVRTRSKSVMFRTR